MGLNLEFTTDLSLSDLQIKSSGIKNRIASKFFIIGVLFWIGTSRERTKLHPSGKSGLIGT